jgi:murein DD-endopeptidase MepM/ murein hydrolase activator NlpD
MRVIPSVLAGLLVLALGSLTAATDPAHADTTEPVGVWPLRPEPSVVTGFDPPDDPWGSGHRGVDLAGRVGQQVLAALPGRVTFAGRLAGKGVVTVSHGDTRTTYEPVAASVAVGDRVAAGDPVGTLELVLGHCLPAACLHWGWLRGETYLDPLMLVGAGPVRLLPLWRDDPVGTTPSTATTTATAWRPLPHPYADWLP